MSPMDPYEKVFGICTQAMILCLESSECILIYLGCPGCCLDWLHHLILSPIVRVLLSPHLCQHLFLLTSSFCQSNMHKVIFFCHFNLQNFGYWFGLSIFSNLPQLFQFLLHSLYGCSSLSVLLRCLSILICRNFQNFLDTSSYSYLVLDMANTSQLSCHSALTVWRILFCPGGHISRDMMRLTQRRETWFVTLGHIRSELHQ